MADLRIDAHAGTEAILTPATVTQLLIILLFVVPGFVYQAVRISVRGRLPMDVELSTRLVRAIVSSAIFALLYVIALGGVLVDAAHGEGTAFEQPRLGALGALVLGIAIPALSAVLPSLAPRTEWLQRLWSKVPEVATYDPTPTAWDKAFQARGPCFIRVLNKDGRWIGGYYGPGSYATSYPEDPEVFLEQAFEISDDGTFGEVVHGTSGVLINCREIQLLQVVELSEGV